MNLEKAGIDPNAFVERAAALTPPLRVSPTRLVFHYQLDERAADDLVRLIQKLRQ